MKMKAKKNEVISEERVCKKCGDPLISTSKYKYCDNCRRERAKTRKEVGGTVLSLGVMVLGSVPVIKNFIKKN